MIRPARVVLILVVVIAAALAVGVLAVFETHTAVPTFDEAPVQVSAPVDAALLVRPDSPVLSGSSSGTGEAETPDDVVTVVEFTDPGCAPCRTAFFDMERIREDYGPEVRFVLRLFPAAGDGTAERAAVAVAAAAEQGYAEQMYQWMFQAQRNWVTDEESQPATFRGFAEGLALDLAAYDRAVADPATLERVRREVADGTTAGVQEAPAVFVDGRRIESASPDGLRQVLDEALAR